MFIGFGSNLRLFSRPAWHQKLSCRIRASTVTLFRRRCSLSCRLSGVAPQLAQVRALEREHREPPDTLPSLQGVKLSALFFFRVSFESMSSMLVQACVQTVCLPHVTLVCTQARGFFPSNGNLAFWRFLRCVVTWPCSSHHCLNSRVFHLPQKNPRASRHGLLTPCHLLARPCL